jgi:hypothetical protein
MSSISVDTVEDPYPSISLHATENPNVGTGPVVDEASAREAKQPGSGKHSKRNRDEDY